MLVSFGVRHVIAAGKHDCEKTSHAERCNGFDIGRATIDCLGLLTSIIRGQLRPRLRQIDRTDAQPAVNDAADRSRFQSIGIQMSKLVLTCKCNHGVKVFLPVAPAESKSNRHRTCVRVCVS